MCTIMSVTSVNNQVQNSTRIDFAVSFEINMHINYRNNHYNVSVKDDLHMISCLCFVSKKRLEIYLYKSEVSKSFVWSRISYPTSILLLPCP